MTPKNRIKKLEEKQGDKELITISINWDGTIPENPGDIVIDWEGDSTIKTRRVKSGKTGEETIYIWAGDKKPIEEPEKDK